MYVMAGGRREKKIIIDEDRQGVKGKYPKHTVHETSAGEADGIAVRSLQYESQRRDV